MRPLYEDRLLNDDDAARRGGLVARRLTLNEVPPLLAPLLRQPTNTLLIQTNSSAVLKYHDTEITQYGLPYHRSKILGYVFNNYNVDATINLYCNDVVI